MAYCYANKNATTRVLTVRMPSDMHDAIVAASATRDQSINEICLRAIQGSLGEKFIEDRRRFDSDIEPHRDCAAVA